MLRKSVIALAAAAALGASSGAMADKGGHSSGGSHGATFSGGGGGGGGAGFAATQGSVKGSVNSGATVPGGTWGPKGNLSQPTTMGPRTVTGSTWSGKTTAWNGPHNRHHRYFRNRNEFFAFGFAGDYGYYDSCWQWVPTNWGLQRVWVCDYPYPY